MRVGIVGFPYSGKSTLFSAISGLPRAQLNLAQENLAAVKVPEPRLDWLEAVYKPKKRTEATIEFVDLPAGAEGDGEHAGLARHLPSLRLADALLVVLRGFASDAVAAHKNRVDARGDLLLMRDELLLADLVICDTRVERLDKSLTKPSKERDQQKAELELLKRCRAALEGGQPLSGVIAAGEEARLVRSFGFLTQKPVITLINVGESDAAHPPAFEDPHAVRTFNVCATIEAEIIQIEPSERPAFMQEWGIAVLARDRVIRACFDALGLISFLTSGEDEVRAWPIPRGTTAVDAAGKIHSDLARGFIRAETVAYADLHAAGTMRDAKAAGKVRQEARNYIVQDGDIMNIKFAV